MNGTLTVVIVSLFYFRFYGDSKQDVYEHHEQQYSHFCCNLASCNIFVDLFLTCLICVLNLGTSRYNCASAGYCNAGRTDITTEASGRYIKKVKSCIAVRANASPLRELTCHMGSHSVTSVSYTHLTLPTNREV